jgi:hypothetical protein
MADERDPKLSRHYRELEPLEPPPELDRKILGAARAAEAPHAPLVAPGGRHRWYYGLAAAAVLMFAVALTLHMERERPDPEAVPGTPLRLERELRGQITPAPREPESKPAAKPAAPSFAPDPRAVATSPRRDERRVEEAAARAEEAAVVAGAKQERAQVTQAEASKLAQREERASQSVAARPMGAPAAAPAAAPPENPERWLERIAELRSRGRHVEADRELAAFRKAYPDYRLSDLMRERVEGTPTPSQR